ncbi:unnamed protein product [Paramecium octaurelia]|uniref:Uncharacterized protein n=1 Tax=Paramecium octaurelia TaxID=43137 RepID=A0A8S1SUU0_PAROT|nr:unnamed protein product [Paramecium octaurelia]
MARAGSLSFHNPHNNCILKCTQSFSFDIHNSVWNNYVMILNKITFVFYNYNHQTLQKTFWEVQIWVICLNNYNIHNLIYIPNYWHYRHNSFECIQIYDTYNKYYQKFQRLIIFHGHLF